MDSHTFFKFQIKPLGHTHILYAQLEACESCDGTLPSVITSAALLLRMQRGDQSEII
ncbi:MAG: hypothetical protein KGH89_08810 [Thaumarchaeota archaeon]|nr:hypothetical protein [Nitrososphaerota archaeon]